MSLTNITLTVIVPAYNEEKSISDTIKSLLKQTHKPDRIIVIDDFSTDKTGEIARGFDVSVIRPKKNTGSKAGAQNFALTKVNTELVMALDADTTLAPNAIDQLLKTFDDKKVVASCGFVIPRRVKTLWERGRYIEYLLAFTFYKPIQNHLGKPLISSGCFSMYQTDILKNMGGWPKRTMAEDMDLTWSFYKKNYRVRFVPDAICYPLEPHNFHFMDKQLKRWSHGYVQNLKIHWKDVLKISRLNAIVAISTWDALMGALLYTLVLPFLTLFFKNPLFLLGYFIDAPITLIPVLYKASHRKEFFKTLQSFPCFLVLRTINSLYILKAFFFELILNKQLLVYEKGH